MALDAQGFEAGQFGPSHQVGQPSRHRRRRSASKSVKMWIPIRFPFASFKKQYVWLPILTGCCEFVCVDGGLCPPAAGRERTARCSD